MNSPNCITALFRPLQNVPRPAGGQPPQTLLVNSHQEVTRLDPPVPLYQSVRLQFPHQTPTEFPG